MNWIIRNTKKLEFHTNLTELLRPIFEDLKTCTWVLSDLDFIAHEEIPIEFGEDYYILEQEDFEKLAKARVQIIWGVISAIPKMKLSSLIKIIYHTSKGMMMFGKMEIYNCQTL